MTGSHCQWANVGAPEFGVIDWADAARVHREREFLPCPNAT
jgi:hypothetical protein